MSAYIFTRLFDDAADMASKTLYNIVDSLWRGFHPAETDVYNSFTVGEAARIYWMQVEFDRAESSLLILVHENNQNGQLIGERKWTLPDVKYDDLREKLLLQTTEFFQMVLSESSTIEYLPGTNL